MKDEIGRNKNSATIEDFSGDFKELPAGAAVLLGDLTIQWANDAFFDLLGSPRDKVCNNFMPLMYPEDAKIFINALSMAGDEGTATVSGLRLFHKKGKLLYVHIALAKLARENSGLLAVFTDITQHMELLQMLKGEQELSRLILELNNDSFFDVDVRGNRIVHSKNFANRFGITQERGNMVQAFVESGIVSPESMPEFLRVVREATTTGSEAGNGMELKLITPQGEQVWYLLQYKVLLTGEGKPQRIIGRLTDITLQKTRIDGLIKKAETDPLTKLYNKEETHRKIEECLAGAEEGDHFALIMLDIDNFKTINDTQGHHTGDKVLIKIAEVIRNLFRESDIIGRIGGDELIVFMRNIKLDTIVEKKAELLCETLREIDCGFGTHQISCSMGIALCPQHALGFEDLYRNADVALYQSKGKGKDCYTIYKPSQA